MKTTKKKLFFTFFTVRTESNRKRQRSTPAQLKNKRSPVPQPRRLLPAGKINTGQTQYMAATFPSSPSL
jgi:hypothetical protein